MRLGVRQKEKRLTAKNAEKTEGHGKLGSKVGFRVTLVLIISTAVLSAVVLI